MTVLGASKWKLSYRALLTKLMARAGRIGLLGGGVVMAKALSGRVGSRARAQGRGSHRLDCERACAPPTSGISLNRP